jgi:uncharacterized membrane protein
VAAMEESEKVMKEKLDKKEYQLQVCEMKIVCYERYLQKKAVKDQEAATLLYKYQQTVFSDSDDDDED